MMMRPLILLASLGDIDSMNSLRIDCQFLPQLETLSIEPSSGESSLLFQMGDVLNGRMIDWIDDHHAVLQFKGQDHSIMSRFPLPRDLEGLFRVEATSPQVILRFIPEEERGVSLAGPRLKQYLPNAAVDGLIEDLGRTLLDLRGMRGEALPLSLQDSLKDLLALFEHFSIPSPASLHPEQVEESVLRSGLFFEGRLKCLIESHLKDQEDQLTEGDLKGLLIKLRSQSEALSPPGGQSEEISSLLGRTGKSMDRILQKMEGYQFLNLPPSDSDGRYFLLLPVWFQNRLRFVEMALSLPRHDSGGWQREGTSILFLLDLPELGKMSIEVRVKEKVLYCRFSVSDEKVSLLLERHVPELHTRLVRFGFEPQLSLSVESPEKMTQSFLQEIGGEKDPLLDVVA
jgi:hypothetical protein